MISLRATGADSGTSGVASQFVGIPKPVGVSDGDIVIAGIALPAAGVTVTAPDESWQLIQQTDPGRSLGLIAFWKVALNEPTNWVFSLSASIQATGVVLVYAGTDTYETVEVVQNQLTAAAAAHGVPAVTASVPEEEYVLLLAGAAAGTYTAVPGNFTQAAAKSQAASQLEAWHKGLASAQKIATFNATFSAAVNGAAMAIILRPGTGHLALGEVRERLVAGLPEGAEDVYDLEAGGDYFKYFQAMAQTFKTFGFDVLDLLRQEVVPFLSRYKLPDWERIFGLEQTTITQTGTIPDRQARVLASWRAAAGEGFSVPAIQAALGPVLGYFPATPVAVVETDRAGLKAAHTYAGGSLSVLAASSTNISWLVFDGGVVSGGGAQLAISTLTGSIENLSAVLVGPNADGTANDPATYVHVPGNGIAYRVFPLGSFGAGAGPSSPGVFAQEAAGGFIHGTWTIRFTNASGTPAAATGVDLFVEGIGPNQATGGAIFDWGVYADPALVGQSGANADYTLARQLIKEMSPAHAVGNLLQSLDPWPDVDVGIHAAIPDECIPT